MKILGKNVIVATNKICIEYTSKIADEINGSIVSSFDYKGKTLKQNIIYIKDKNGYYVALEDLKSFPTLSLICYGAAQRWKSSPHHVGDVYIDDIKPYFSKLNQETLYDLKTLVKILEIDKLIELEDNSQLIK